MESTKRTTRRVLAILMAIAMVFGMITPQIAYAIGDDELSGAPAAEQPQEVVNDTPEPADADPKPADPDPEPPAPAKAGEEGPDRGGESGEEFSWVDTYGAPCEPKADFTLFLKWLGDQYYLPGGRFYEEIGGPKLQVGIVGP
ncbi:MAG: hypothetical protein II725_02330, partial [Firmicutes bacterium]|nr:hypothetical protein [Bacillota bacterium]